MAPDCVERILLLRHDAASSTRGGVCAVRIEVDTAGQNNDLEVIKMKPGIPAVSLSLTLLLALLLVGAAFASPAHSAGTPRPDDARAYIITPSHGDTVDRTFTVRFGLRGMGVAPAGCDVPDTGHHHLLVDNEVLPPPDQPMGDDIRHFGGGQTQAQITLPPGEHTLLLILGDKNHVPHSPPVMSEQIRVLVE
jgi:hypothetical protein